MLRIGIFIIILMSILTACSKSTQESPSSQQTQQTKQTASATTAANNPLLIAPEDLITLRSDTLTSGPVITGSIQPERRADLRAEIPAVVLQVLKENGENVKKGDVLVRLDSTSIRDSLTSAEESMRSSTQAFDQAERQFQRLKTLRASGMASAQQLEDAEIRRNNAQSDMAAAKARAVQARQQMQRTEVRAPFDGIVSERKVSAGDTAQIGKELVKVIDPASVRFEGFVSADKIGSVQPGQTVHFRVNGYDRQEFAGTVKRVDPAANPTTRQVEVLVAFADGNHPRVSGLYAEGRIETGGTPMISIPEAALVRNGDQAYAWRIHDGTLRKVHVELGERDPRRGNVVIKNGLANGDKVVRNPVPSLKDGLKIELTNSAASASAITATTATAEK